MVRQIAERRKNLRVDTDLPNPTLELTEELKPALLKNISISGLACISSTRIPEMTLVELNLQLPALPKEEAELYPFHCKGAVVRCDAVDRCNSRKKWYLAIYFTEVDDANKELLQRYISSRS